MHYTKNKVIRCRQLTKDYFELVIQKDPLFKFTPGNMIALCAPGCPETINFIASEPSCGWIRVIMDNKHYETFEKCPTVKVLGVMNLLPELYQVAPEHKITDMIISGTGISVNFSYASTYKDFRPNIHLLGNEESYPNLEWIKEYQVLLPSIPLSVNPDNLCIIVESQHQDLVSEVPARVKLIY